MQYLLCSVHRAKRAAANRCASMTSTCVGPSSSSTALAVGGLGAGTAVCARTDVHQVVRAVRALHASTMSCIPCVLYPMA